MIKSIELASVKFVGGRLKVRSSIRWSVLRTVDSRQNLSAASLTVFLIGKRGVRRPGLTIGTTCRRSEQPELNARFGRDFLLLKKTGQFET